MLRVGQVMSRLSVCLYSYHSIGDALTLMMEKKVTGLPLLNEQGHLLGMVTKDQVNEKGLKNFAATKKATDYLTTRFLSLNEEASLEDVWNLPFDIYPVFNNQEEITGVVSKYSLLQAYLHEVQARSWELEAVFDSAHNGILAINRQGIITSLNPAAERPTCSTKEEAVGRFLTDVIVPTGLLEVVRSGIPEFGIKFQVGRRQYITNRTPIIKDGEVVGAVGVFQEVSEIEKILQELQSEKQLNEELQTIVVSSYQLSEKYQSKIAQMKNNWEKGADLKSRSVVMNNVLDLAFRVSQVDSPVVLVGEQGVGKENIAKLIHSQSKRSDGPFYNLNCGSLPAQLLEIELFGQGISIGNGDKGKTGVLELANQGSVYLEEIGKMPLNLQGRLVRVLQDKMLQATGEKETTFVDPRIMAGTDRPLKELVEKGLFRSDLFYTLNVVPIKVPALRERKEDLIPLALFYLEKNNKRHGFKKIFSPEAVQLLLDYPWFDNAREMANVIERLVVTANQKVISAQEVDIVLYEKEQSPFKAVTVTGVVPLKEAIDDLEHQLVTLAMKLHGTTVKAAQALGVNQSTVVRKLHKSKDTNGGKCDGGYGEVKRVVWERR